MERFPSGSRARFARGTDVLYGEQVDEYAALTRRLMARGLVEPIGSVYSRCAAEVSAAQRKLGPAFVREYAAAERAAAWHRDCYWWQYEPTRRPEPRPIVLSGVILPDREANGHGFTVADRFAWDLEAAADALLREAGETVHRLDVRDGATRLMTVAPDRLAYRGVPTSVLPASADESRAVSYRRARVKVRHTVQGPRRVTRPDVVSADYRTDPDEVWADVMLGRAHLIRRTECETIQLRRGKRIRIIGHRPGTRMDDAQTRRIRKRSAARATARAEGKARPAGRPAANPLTAGTSTLRRHWAAASDAQRAAADALVALLTTTTAEHVLPTTVGHVLIVDAQVSGRLGDGPCEPIPTIARRLALVGATVTD